MHLGPLGQVDACQRLWCRQESLVFHFPSCQSPGLPAVPSVQPPRMHPALPCLYRWTRSATPSCRGVGRGRGAAGWASSRRVRSPEALRAASAGSQGAPQWGRPWTWKAGSSLPRKARPVTPRTWWVLPLAPEPHLTCCGQTASLQAPQAGAGGLGAHTRVWLLF